MVGGIVGGGFCDIKNCIAAADITLSGTMADGSPPSNAGILAGGMEDGSFINCSVSGGSIKAAAGSNGIGGLASCALGAAKLEGCTVSGVNITVGENCFMIGGLLGYTGTYAPAAPTSINNCMAANVAISAPGSAERIGGIVGGGFYWSVYAAYRPIPSAFTVRNSLSSGSITGCTNLVGTIAGYIYDNSTVDSTCTSAMTGPSNTVGGDKTSADLPALK
jgi:hypothetical protein